MNVPQLPIGPIVDKEGNLTNVGKNFFNQLISELQTNYSNEGLVAPTQVEEAKPNNNITQIQDHKNSAGQYTCQYGTFLYDSTHNEVKVCVNKSLDPIDPGYNTPIFKTVTIT